MPEPDATIVAAARRMEVALKAETHWSNHYDEGRANACGRRVMEEIGLISRTPAATPLGCAIKA